MSLQDWTYSSLLPKLVPRVAADFVKQLKICKNLLHTLTISDKCWSLLWQSTTCIFVFILSMEVLGFEPLPVGLGCRRSRNWTWACWRLSKEASKRLQTSRWIFLALDIRSLHFCNWEKIGEICKKGFKSEIWNYQPNPKREIVIVFTKGL